MTSGSKDEQVGIGQTNHSCMCMMDTTLLLYVSYCIMKFSNSMSMAVSNLSDTCCFANEEKHKYIRLLGNIILMTWTVSSVHSRPLPRLSSRSIAGSINHSEVISQSPPSLSFVHPSATARSLHPPIHVHYHCLSAWRQPWLSSWPVSSVPKV